MDKNTVFWRLCSNLCREPIGNKGPKQRIQWAIDVPNRPKVLSCPQMSLRFSLCMLWLGLHIFAVSAQSVSSAATLPSLPSTTFSPDSLHMGAPISDSNHVYKFTEYQDVWIKTNLTGRSFEAYWLQIFPDGKMLIKCSNQGGYSWDGCTPKWKVGDKIWGTPDGRTDPSTGKPITYYASMVHDVLFHYGLLTDKQLPISRHEADKLFVLLLREAKFRWWPFYQMGVRAGGGFYGHWFQRGIQKGIKVESVSWRNK